MIEIELSNEAFEEVRGKCIAAGLIVDERREWDEDARPFTVGGVTFKEWKYVPTPEDIARQEEYRKTPLGQLMDRSIEAMASETLNKIQTPNPFIGLYSQSEDFRKMLDNQNTKIGTTLRIRMPADYKVKND